MNLRIIAVFLSIVFWFAPANASEPDHPNTRTWNELELNRDRLDVAEYAAARYILRLGRVSYPEAPHEFQNPETLDETEDRLVSIALADYEASSTFENGFHPNDALALLIATQYGESGFEYRVHAGLKSHLGHQDGGKAKCLGQIRTWEGNPLLTEDEHKNLAGIDYESTVRCAKAMLRYYWHEAKVCGIRMRLRSETYSEVWSRRRMSEIEAETLMMVYATGSCSQSDDIPAWKHRVINLRGDSWTSVVRVIERHEQRRKKEDFARAG